MFWHPVTLVDENEYPGDKSAGVASRDTLRGRGFRSAFSDLNGTLMYIVRTAFLNSQGVLGFYMILPCTEMVLQGICRLAWELFKLISNAFWSVSRSCRLISIVLFQRFIVKLIF